MGINGYTSGEALSWCTVVFDWIFVQSVLCHIYYEVCLLYWI